MQDNQILVKLESIERLLSEQNLLSKNVLNLNEAATYLDMSTSYLYKLTSTRQIPHFCPLGKKLYFKRLELENWLQRNRQSTSQEAEESAFVNISHTGK